VGTTSARTLGTGGGEEKHAQNVAEMPAHAHTISSFKGDGTEVGFGNSPSVYLEGTSANDTGPSTDNNGGSTPFNVMSPFAVINWIIKT
jgi:microcystin-dependent protein